MNNNRLTASKSKAALEEQSYDLIQQHIIDPENSPLPEHLRVLPGHGEETTIEDEKKYNPFVR